MRTFGELQWVHIFFCEPARPSPAHPPGSPPPTRPLPACTRPQIRPAPPRMRSMSKDQVQVPMLDRAQKSFLRGSIEFCLTWFHVIRHGLISKLDGALLIMIISQTINPQRGNGNTNKLANNIRNLGWLAKYTQTCYNFLLCSSLTFSFPQLVSFTYSCMKANFVFQEFLSWLHRAITSAGM